MGEEGVSPDTEDYSSTSVDGKQVESSDEPEEIQEVRSNNEDEIEWDAREIKRLKKIRKRRKQKAKLRLTWDVAVPYVQEMVTRLTAGINKQLKDQNFLRKNTGGKRKSAPPSQTNFRGNFTMNTLISMKAP